MRRMGLIGCAVIGALVVTADAAHAAEGDRGARWFVDSMGGCTNDRGAFEREVTLACAAVGTCHVVGDPRAAELRATLRCFGRDEPWTLELRTVEGTLVSTTDLAGAPSDRMREAAIEIARDQAPERTLAAASLQNTLGDGDRVSPKKWRMPTVSLAVGAAGGLGTPEGFSGGGRGLLAIAVASGAHLTLGMTGLMGGSAGNQARHFRGGVGVAFGAPFDGSVFGIMLEGGLDVGQSYLLPNVGYRSNSAQTRLGPYGQGAIVLAVPLRGVRPYLALAGGAYSAPTTTPYATADIGLAFPLF